MPVTLTGIDGLLVVERDTILDGRGVFRETYRRSELEEALGRPVRLAQNNHSRSAAGVLRGFHIEPWDKFLYVPHGTAFVAILDVRRDSRTYGRVETMTIGDPPGRPARVFIPRGLANAFQALTELDYLNDVSEEYTPHGRGGVAWDDPDLGVAWPITQPVLSDVDRGWPRLRDLPQLPSDASPRARTRPLYELMSTRRRGVSRTMPLTRPNVESAVIHSETDS